MRTDMTASSGGRWMVYGAYGYTGELIAREAVRRGLKPVLAGRDGDRLEPLAAELGLSGRAFPLSDPGSLRAALADVELVLHCAGPFLDTSRPMVAACLAARRHYLDITGEIGVFESVLARDAKAREAGVVLLPGVGFDVVPTDCVAARLAAALPEATDLELAFVGEGGGVSRGTAKTMVRGLPYGGAERRDGKIVRVPAAADAEELDFPLPEGGTLRRWVVQIPWGDVSTAFHTTGIPNVRTYTGMAPKAIRRLRRARVLLPLAGLAPVQRLLAARIDRRYAEQAGPGEDARRAGRIHVLGTATAPDGRTATAAVTTPEGYAFTAAASVECVTRVLDGRASPGAWTPAGAFGPDLVDAIEGVWSGEVKVALGPG